MKTCFAISVKTYTTLSPSCGTNGEMKIGKEESFVPRGKEEFRGFGITGSQAILTGREEGGRSKATEQEEETSFYSQKKMTQSTKEENKECKDFCSKKRLS